MCHTIVCSCSVLQSYCKMVPYAESKWGVKLHHLLTASLHYQNVNRKIAICAILRAQIQYTHCILNRYLFLLMTTKEVYFFKEHTASFDEVKDSLAKLVKNGDREKNEDIFNFVV